MSEQWDLPMGRRLRNRAVKKVQRKTDPEWFNAALACVVETANSFKEFTTDDVRLLANSREIGEPHEPRAWGAVMAKAARDGICEKTGLYVQTSRPRAHARPIPVYHAGAW